MPELNITLRPSPQLATFIAATHSLAAAAIWFSAIPWWLCLTANAAVAGSLLWHLQQHYWVGHRQLACHENRWRLINHTGEEPLELIGEFLVTPWLLVLRFRTQTGRTQSLILPPDSAATDDLRQLRVLLRFGLKTAD